MKIRTKLTIFFTIIFFILVLVLSIWYQYRLFYVLRQESIKNLDMFSNSFFRPGHGSFNKFINLNEFKNEFYKRLNRDDFFRMISKRTWITLYDNNLNVVESSFFAKEFPLSNFNPDKTDKYFTVKLKVDSSYFTQNKIDIFPENKLMMDQEFYTDKENFSFNCIGKINIINSGEYKFYLVILFPDDKNVNYLQKTLFNVIFSLLFFICIIIIIALFYSKYSLNPINKIIHELNKISEHDLSKRINLNINNKDEISEISLSINNLLNRIENAFKMEKQFISDVSHEFKTPISILQLNIDNISNNPNLTDDEIDKISSSLEILYTLNFLIQKLLYLSRLESNLCSFNPQVISCNELLNAIINNLKNIAEIKNLKFDLFIKNENLQINGDYELLYIALFNIIENALKYTEKGSVSISIEKDNNQTKIIIEDTGIGIPENKYNKIFDKFYKVDAARQDNKSFGIGLTISKRILDIHKATIQIESVEKQKTKFTIIF